MWGVSTSSHTGLYRGFPVWGVNSMGRGGTLDGWGCSGRLGLARCLVLPDEEEPELIEMLSFLTLGLCLSCFLCVLALRLCLSRALTLENEQESKRPHFAALAFLKIRTVACSVLTRLQNSTSGEVSLIYRFSNTPKKVYTSGLQLTKKQ